MSIHNTLQAKLIKIAASKFDYIWGVMVKTIFNVSEGERSETCLIFIQMHISYLCTIFLNLILQI